MTKDLGASVRARLLNLAKSEGSDFNQVLVRYTLERFLYRLSQSDYADQFLLKGALLFTLWYDQPHRATRDADLLGFDSSDLNEITRVFREIANVQAEDGISFDAKSVATKEIRKEASYQGARVLITATIANARCKTQIDIGFGDAVTPEPIDAIFPVMLTGSLAPKLRTYPVYTVIAEKLHAVVLLGMTNSRLKDYLDLWVLLTRETPNTSTLKLAITATFERRSTPIPLEMPIGLTDQFAQAPSKQTMWNALVTKNEIEATPLTTVVREIRQSVRSVLIASDSR